MGPHLRDGPRRDGVAARHASLQICAGSTDGLLATGISRRNGAVVAAAALQGIEAHLLAGDDRAAERLRHHAARVCWLLGAQASLSLLLRWRRADPDA